MKQTTNLLADTPMPASTKRLVWAESTLADSTEAKVDRLAVLINVFFQGLGSKVFGVGPALGVKLFCVRPYRGIVVADRRRGENVVALGNNVGTFFGRRGKRGGNRHVVTDMAKDTVDGRVETEGFVNEGVHDGHFLELIIGNGGEFAVSSTELFHLLFV